MAVEQRRVKEGTRPAHQLRQPAPQQQPAAQSQCAHQQPFKQVDGHNLPRRRPPAAHEGDFSLAALHDHVGDEADEVQEQSHEGQAEDGQGEGEQAVGTAVTLQRRHRGSVQRRPVQQCRRPRLDDGDPLQQLANGCRADATAVI